ncbi:ferritin [Allorhodopirellula solitaria]|uniref:Ferritin n=1 Tax=Allorhodopirellula solitaria TaxID=2527987 RepID=A0A5C5WZ64_9BACT|nr:ferritin [Allorhodopirellula solitaria]TWT55936.1 putative ferritin-1 [Allorhodopirellula solitaria]
MKTKRISEAMEKALNTQMTREAYQAQVYLAYASWAEVNGFTGISEFLYKHMEEERMHMSKFLKFINDRGGHARIAAIEAPPADPKDLGDCLRQALQHEINNSKAIDEIVHLAHEEKDWATFSFGQWFVKEQIEEETLINELLDKYNLAAGEETGNAGLYEFDRDTATASQEATLPRDEVL